MNLRKYNAPSPFRNVYTTMVESHVSEGEDNIIHVLRELEYSLISVMDGYYHYHSRGSADMRDQPIIIVVNRVNKVTTKLLSNESTDFNKIPAGSGYIHKITKLEEDNLLLLI